MTAPYLITTTTIQLSVLVDRASLIGWYVRLPTTPIPELTPLQRTLLSRLLLLTTNPLRDSPPDVFPNQNHDVVAYVAYVEADLAIDLLRHCPGALGRLLVACGAQASQISGRHPLY